MIEIIFLFCIRQDLSNTFLYNVFMEKRSFDANRIKELRVEHGLSQCQLSKILDIKQANISRWECAKVVPNVIDAWVIAEYFGVSVDYLIGKEVF